MSEYIEREAAIACLHFVCVPQCRKYAQEEIKKIPAADVAPVRHGRWEKNSDGIMVWWECSECHHDAWYDGDGLYNYCPNCGADMREVTE